jgi:hypothetical protein
MGLSCKKRNFYVSLHNDNKNVKRLMHLHIVISTGYKTDYS